MSARVSARRLVWVAIQSFLSIAALIVQVELTIVWNIISGLAGPGTARQLIPFIVGIGSLLRVFLEKWRSYQGGKRGEEELILGRGRYEKAVEKNLDWKSERETASKEQYTQASQEDIV